MKYKLMVAGLFASLLSLQVSANACPSLLKFVKRKLNSQETVNLCQATKVNLIIC